MQKNMPVAWLKSLSEMIEKFVKKHACNAIFRKAVFWHARSCVWYCQKQYLACRKAVSCTTMQTDEADGTVCADVSG